MAISPAGVRGALMDVSLLPKDDLVRHARLGLGHAAKHAFPRLGLRKPLGAGLASAVAGRDRVRKISPRSCPQDMPTSRKSRRRPRGAARPGPCHGLRSRWTCSHLARDPSSRPPFDVLRSRTGRPGPRIRPFPASRSGPDARAAPMPGVRLRRKTHRPGRHPVLATPPRRRKAAAATDGPDPEGRGGNLLDLSGAENCAIAPRVRTVQARDEGSIRAGPPELPSVQPTDLCNALRAAGAASHRGDGVADAGLLAVPSDEDSDRNVAGMSAGAHDPEAAAAETAQPPPLETQRNLLPGAYRIPNASYTHLEAVPWRRSTAARPDPSYDGGGRVQTRKIERPDSTACRSECRLGTDQRTQWTAGQAATITTMGSDRRRFQTGSCGHTRDRDYGWAHLGAAPNGID